MKRRPADRVRRVLTRLSRDRYIPAREVAVLAHQVASKYSYNPCHTAEAAVHPLCRVIGMIRGEPPVYANHPAYEALHRMCIGRQRPPTNIELLTAIVKASHVR